MIDILLNESSYWMTGQGPDAEIVLTSRMRIARNIKGIPFPNRADSKQRNKVFGVIEKAVKNSQYMQGSLVLKFDKMDALDRQFLVERRIISREHAGKTSGSGVAISEKEIVSVMINEEDHIRMQVLYPGFQLLEVWKLADQLDTEFEKNIEYAFSPTLGHLTACPTNVGTGIRASVMLHLPALVLAKQIEQVIQAILKLGLAVRGLYGEGTEASGNIFQISNQVTLGKSEQEIVNNLEGVIRQIVGHERNARQLLLKNKVKQVEDRVYRAYGLLSNVRTITSKETVDLLSALRMGVDLGIMKDVERSTINELFVITQPAHLQKIADKKLGPNERDVMRADLIRGRLNK
jgi:protein arginine kinase